MNTKSLVAGFGGAILLNILHESLKHYDNTPRVDLVGEEALQKSLGAFGISIDDPQRLYFATLIADIISNGLFYSAICTDKNIWQRAITVGAGAGIGAVMLPEKLGLDDKPVAKNTQVKTLTVGYYLFGALATAAIFKAISK